MDEAATPIPTPARPCRPWFAAGVAVALGVAAIATGRPGAAAQSVDPAGALAAIVEEWSHSTSDRRVPDVSIEATERIVERALATVERLDAIDPAGLTHQEQLSLAVLRWVAAALSEDLEVYWYSSPIMPAVSPLRTIVAGIAAARFEDAEDVDAYLAFLDECVAAAGEIATKVRGRAARGIILPDEQIDRVLPYLASFTARGEASPLWVGDERLAALDDGERDRLRSEARQKIDRGFAPRLRRLHRYVDETLRDRAPNAVGMGQYPGGRRAYRILVRHLTTLDVTPEQVHEIGMAAVEEINRQMAEVRERLGFTGTRAEFHDQLRSDPRFYVDEPHEFGDRLMAFDARLRPHVFDFFLREPEAPYGVRRVDPALEASMTYGYYNGPLGDDPNGYYNYNGSKLSERSLLSGAALTYHELVPGHHFQIQLQAENEELPEFRRLGYYAGYGEGWGEYSSSVVAREMGMYDDPYDLYGRLVFDNFFAVRLVVDTGMNFYGWSRPKAMLFMREHTMESDVQIDSETIRYSMRSPAQALAYRMGRETFVDLRTKAEAALGADFDVRAFHEAVLSVGSMPLTVLQEHVDWWLKQREASDG